MRKQRKSQSTKVIIDASSICLPKSINQNDYDYIKAYNAIKYNIITGKFPIGKTISASGQYECENATPQPIKRRCIAMALDALLNEGFLKKDSPKSVARIVSAEPADIMFAYDLFKQIQVSCACQIAESNEKDELIKKITDINQQFHRAIHLSDDESKLKNIYVIDANFHQAIIQSSGNPITLAVYKTLEPYFYLYKLFYFRTNSSKDYDEIYNEHNRLIDAINNNDSGEIEHIVTVHSHHTWEIIEDVHTKMQPEKTD